MPTSKQITGAIILVEVDNGKVYQAVVPVLHEAMILDLLVKKGTEDGIEVMKKEINFKFKTQ